MQENGLGWSLRECLIQKRIYVERGVVRFGRIAQALEPSSLLFFSMSDVQSVLCQAKPRDFPWLANAAEAWSHFLALPGV